MHRAEQIVRVSSIPALDIRHHMHAACDLMQSHALILHKAQFISIPNCVIRIRVIVLGKQQGIAMNPAQEVIKRLGGDRAVAELLTKHGYPCHTSSVTRWRLPDERGGCGGLVPSSRIQQLLLLAPVAGIALEAADFFTLP